MRILVAEDERALSKALCVILEKNGYHAEPVYDGEEALDYIVTGHYDAVLLDIMMPKVDGVTVLKTVRRAGNAVPVLLLTAKSSVDDKVEGLDAGANDYLTKPFDFKELLARIRVMTRSGDPAPDPTLRFGNLSLDLAGMELSGPALSYTLTSKEFQMAQIFLSRPKTVISAEQLLENIWGYDTEVEIGTVWVYISYLRKKLEALGANVRIRAVRGAGYMLEEKEK